MGRCTAALYASLIACLLVLTQQQVRVNKAVQNSLVYQHQLVYEQAINEACQENLSELRTLSRMDSLYRQQYYDWRGNEHLGKEDDDDR